VRFALAVELRARRTTTSRRCCGEGRLGERKRPDERALRLLPEYPEAITTSRTVLLDEGKPGEAVDHFRRDPADHPGIGRTYTTTSGLRLVDRGSSRSGIAEFPRRAQVDPIR